MKSQVTVILMILFCRYSDVITECWYPPTARPTMDSVYASLKHHFDGGAGASADLYYDENEIAEMEDELYDDNALPSPPYKH